MIRRPDRAAAGGFTLIELLLAATLTASLSGALLFAVVQVLDLWTRSGRALTADGEATRILDQITADLESAVLRPDPQAWLAATVQRDQVGAGDAGMADADWSGLVKPPGAASHRLGPSYPEITDLRFGQAGVWLRFFTVEPDANDRANNRSLPRAVAYQLVRRRTGSRHVYQLFRSQVRPGGANSTFSSGYDLFAPAYTTPNGSEQHPGNVRRPNARFLLGNHVVDFGLRVFIRNADQTEAAVFPSSGASGESFVATAGQTSVPGYAGRPVVRGWPARVEVMVRVLSEAGAQRVDLLESGRLPLPAGLSFAEAWWQEVEAYSHVQVRSISLRAPLP